MSQAAMGALAGAYFFSISKQSFLNALWILQGAMVVSILAMLACKHFDSLVEVMQKTGMEHYIGFYNDIIQWRYAPGNGYFAHNLGMLPLEWAPPGGAIIGAGGDRQVQYARKSSGLQRLPLTCFSVINTALLFRINREKRVEWPLPHTMQTVIFKRE